MLGSVEREVDDGGLTVLGRVRFVLSSPSLPPSLPTDPRFRPIQLHLNGAPTARSVYSVMAPTALRFDPISRSGICGPVPTLKSLASQGELDRTPLSPARPSSSSRAHLSRARSYLLQWYRLI